MVAAIARTGVVDAHRMRSARCYRFQFWHITSTSAKVAALLQDGYRVSALEQLARRDRACELGHELSRLVLGEVVTLLSYSTTLRRLVVLLCHLAHDLKVIVDDVHCAPFLFIFLLPAFLLEEGGRCESFDINGCDLGWFKLDP